MRPPVERSPTPGDGSGSGRIESLAVGITLHRPDEVALFALLDTVRDYGGPVLLHVDGPAPNAIDVDLLEALRRDRDITVLQAAANGGIGAALNRLHAEAERLGCQAILFFDQDSAPLPQTARLLSHALEDLSAKGLRPAVVGPTPVARKSDASKPPTYRARRIENAPAGCRATDFVIVSGSLVSMAVLRDVGPFRADFGMDAIDVEWCFRAWAKGYTVWHLPDAAMSHRVGTGVVALGPLRFPRQSSERMRGYVRNQFHLLRLRHVPVRWKLRTLVYVPAQVAAFLARTPGGRFRLAALMLRAAIDGLAARFRTSADER